MAATPPRILAEPRVVGDVRATLGEGLCWSPSAQALWWVDILEHRLYRDGDAGAHDAWSFDETISAVAERAGGAGLAVTLRRGLSMRRVNAIDTVWLYGSQCESRGMPAPLEPTRKSRSAPRCACCTWST